MAPVNDVIAKIPGSVYPDEWVIRGNHHDGWVNGAEDPLSGQSAMLEEARVFGRTREARLEAQANAHLLRVGWRRRRLARLDGVGRNARRGTRQARRRLHQFRRQRPRLSWPRRLAHARKIHERRGATTFRIPKRNSPSGSANSCARSKRRPPTRSKTSASAPICTWARSAPARISRRFSSTSASLRSTSALAAKMAAESITRFTTTSTGTRTSAIRTSSMAARSRRPAAAP